MGNRCCGHDGKEHGDPQLDPIALRLQIEKLDKDKKELMEELDKKPGGNRLTKQLSSHLGEARGGDEFFTKVLEIMWPYLSKFISNMITEKVEPAIKRAMPKLAAALAFDPNHCHLGEAHAKMTDMRTQKMKQMAGGEEIESVRITTNLEWEGDCSIYLTYATIGIGISDVVIRGQLTIELVGLLERPPFFGGLRAYFLDKPSVSLETAGSLSAISGVSGGLLKSKLISVVATQVAKALVAPKRIAVKMDKKGGKEIYRIKSPPPEGVLWLTVWSATDIIAADINILSSATSDPYVTIECGAETYKSSTVYATLNPEFKDEKGRPWTVPIRISDTRYQTIKLQLHDEDTCKAHDFLGRLEFTAHDAHEWRGETQSIELLDEAGEKGRSGQIQISARWQDLWMFEKDVPSNRQARGVPPNVAAPCAIFLIGVPRARNLPRYKAKTKYWTTVTSEDGLPDWGEGPSQTSPKKRLADDVDVVDDDNTKHGTEEDEEFAEEARQKIEAARKYNMDAKHIAMLLNVPVEDAKKIKRMTDDEEILKMLRSTARTPGEVEWGFSAEYMFRDVRKAKIKVELFCQEPGGPEQKLGTFEETASHGLNFEKRPSRQTVVKLPGTSIYIGLVQRVLFLTGKPEEYVPLQRFTSPSDPTGVTRPSFMPPPLPIYENGASGNLANGKVIHVTHKLNGSSITASGNFDMQEEDPWGDEFDSAEEQ